MSIASFSLPSVQFALVLGMAVAVARPAAGQTATTATAFPPELVEFVPYEGNPVFSGRGPGHWDEKIRERGWILREEGIFRLWYTGYQPGGPMKLGYATSADGLHWTRHGDQPLYTQHWIEDVMVVRQEGTYYMFAEGLKDRAQLLTSPDGLHWTRSGQLDIRLTSGEPIPDGPYGTPTAWREGGQWYLMYERRDEGVWLARSPDLATFVNVQDEPVLSPGPDAYDGEMVAANQVLHYGGRYYLFYHGRGPTEDQWTTNVAASEDLLHWQKYPGNPLFPAEANRSSGIVVGTDQGLRLYTMHGQVEVFLPADRHGR